MSTTNRNSAANFCALVSVYWALRIRLNGTLGIRFWGFGGQDPDYQYPTGLTVFSDSLNWAKELDGLNNIPQHSDLKLIARLMIKVHNAPDLRVTIINSEGDDVRHQTLLEQGKSATRCRLCVAGVYRSWDEINLAPYVQWLEESIQELRQQTSFNVNHGLTNFASKVFELVRLRKAAGVEWKLFDTSDAYSPGIYAYDSEGGDGVIVNIPKPSNFHDSTENEEPIMLNVVIRDKWSHVDNLQHAGINDLLHAGLTAETGTLFLGTEATSWRELGPMDPWFDWLDEQIAQWTPQAPVVEPTAAEKLRKLAEAADRLQKVNPSHPSLKLIGEFADLFELQLTHPQKGVDKLALRKLLGLASELVGLS